MVWNNCSAVGVNLTHIWDSTTNSWEKFTWKKCETAKTETFLHCANFWNAAHYASVDHNILWVGCTAGWNAAVEIDKRGNTAGRSIFIAPLHCCTGTRLHWALSLIVRMTGSLQDPLSSSDRFCRGLKKSAVASLVRDQKKVTRSWKKEKADGLKSVTEASTFRKNCARLKSISSLTLLKENEHAFQLEDNTQNISTPSPIFTILIMKYIMLMLESQDKAVFKGFEVIHSTVGKTDSS